MRPTFQKTSGSNSQTQTIALLLWVLMFFAADHSVAGVQTNPVSVASDKVSNQTKKVRYLSFKEWKTEKIATLESKLKLLKLANKDPVIKPEKGSRVLGLYNPAKTEAGSGELSSALAELNLVQNTLEGARELTFADYVAGYLTKVLDKQAAIRDIAPKMTSEEVAELMSAYVDSVFTTYSEGLGQTAQDSKEGLR